ncbi:unnamed protein product [Parnassius apollo]|uniref:(apollo) hypothetical protein n=1 Tax=Parnassius apollo TaxID=110799 RepID=A0A8S3XTF7_PARAO|nr:unnamed protein product [Parnassius apollo]
MCTCEHALVDDAGASEQHGIAGYDTAIGRQHQHVTGQEACRRRHALLAPRARGHTGVPVSMISLTMQVPVSSMASQGMTQPSGGSTNTSRGKRRAAAVMHSSRPARVVILVYL